MEFLRSSYAWITKLGSSLAVVDRPCNSSLGLCFLPFFLFFSMNFRCVKDMSAFPRSRDYAFWNGQISVTHPPSLQPHRSLFLGFLMQCFLKLHIKMRNFNFFKRAFYIRMIKTINEGWAILTLTQQVHGWFLKCCDGDFMGEWVVKIWEICVT